MLQMELLPKRKGKMEPLRKKRKLRKQEVHKMILIQVEMKVEIRNKNKNKKIKITKMTWW